MAAASAAAAVLRAAADRAEAAPVGHPGGVLSKLAADIGPGNAQSIPLPLLVLGGLALLLLLTAALTWFMRRLQARRVTPAPAIAKRR